MSASPETRAAAIELITGSSANTKLLNRKNRATAIVEALDEAGFLDGRPDACISVDVNRDPEGVLFSRENGIEQVLGGFLHGLLAQCADAAEAAAVSDHAELVIKTMVAHWASGECDCAKN